MSKRFNLTVPTKYTHNGTEKTKYTDVGTAFINDGPNGQSISIKLDFPVGATDLAAFEVKPKGDKNSDNS